MGNFPFDLNGAENGIEGIAGKKGITLLSPNGRLYKSNAILSAEPLEYDVSNDDKSIFVGGVWKRSRKEKYFRAV